MLSASGGLPPDPLTRGSAPGPRWGLCPQTPVIGSCSALAMVPHQPLTPSAAYAPLEKILRVSLGIWFSISHAMHEFRHGHSSQCQSSVRVSSGDTNAALELSQMLSTNAHVSMRGSS